MWLDKKRNSNVQHANTSATEQPVLENKKNYIYVFNVWCDRDIHAMQWSSLVSRSLTVPLS